MVDEDKAFNKRTATPEVRTILPGLRVCQDSDDVVTVTYEESQKWFGPEIAGGWFAYSYRVIYRVEDQVVTIAAIIHGRRLLNIESDFGVSSNEEIKTAGVRR